MTAIFPGARAEGRHAGVGVSGGGGRDHNGHRVIELCALPNRSADVDRFHVDEGFVEYQEIVIGETRQFHGLHARAGVRDDVPVLLKDALQRPAHPIVAAGNQSKRRTFPRHFHRGSSSVARLAWRFPSALASWLCVATFRWVCRFSEVLTCPDLPRTG